MKKEYRSVLLISILGKKNDVHLKNCRFHVTVLGRTSKVAFTVLTLFKVMECSKIRICFNF